MDRPKLTGDARGVVKSTSRQYRGWTITREWVSEYRNGYSMWDGCCLRLYVTADRPADENKWRKVHLYGPTVKELKAEIDWIADHSA
jgi:hypothetical protein